MTLPKSRGFACVGLDRPKTASNVGAILRACFCYGVAQVNISKARVKDFDAKCNTPKAHRHLPVFLVDSPTAYVPHNAKIVVVDLLEGAIPLPEFVHPERAIYILGPEDGTVGKEILSKADFKVMVPTRSCMNLAAAVNVVLYDRMAKGAAFGEAFEASKTTSYISRRYKMEPAQ